MRVALVVALLLSLGAVGHSEDDDGVLDTSPLGDGIPARVEELEREWADDVGIKEPVEEPSEEPDAGAPEPADAVLDDEPESAKAPPVVEPPHPKPPSALSKPLGGDASGGRPSSDDPHASPAGRPRPPSSRAERRATSED